MKPRKVLCCVLLVCVVLITNLQNVLTQMNQFIRDCNDPMIVNHMAKFGHTYCTHTCGDFMNAVGGMASCNAGGYCLCPCVANGPQVTFSTDICPPRPFQDPPDPDPNALPRCQALCASVCPGGQGMICGEVEVLFNGPNMVFAKICTCICPPTGCPSSTTGTTTPRTALVVFKRPLLKLKAIKKWKIWVILQKIAFLGFALWGLWLKWTIFRTLCLMYLEMAAEYIFNVLYGILQIGRFIYRMVAHIIEISQNKFLIR